MSYSLSRQRHLLPRVRFPASRDHIQSFSRSDARRKRPRSRQTRFEVFEMKQSKPRSNDPLSPALVIDTAMYERLRSVASAAMHDAPDVAEPLLEEIERAEIVASDAMPADVVSIGSIVTSRDVATGSTRTIELVWPGDADPKRHRFSVVSPFGASLIGLPLDRKSVVSGKKVAVA